MTDGKNTLRIQINFPLHIGVVHKYGQEPFNFSATSVVKCKIKLYIFDFWLKPFFKYIILKLIEDPIQSIRHVE